MRLTAPQLARFGDILETLPAIQALKNEHPETKITLANLDELLLAHDALVTARRLAEHGQLHCLNGQFEKLAQVECLLEDLENSTPLVKPLIDNWRVTKEQYSTFAQNELLVLTESGFRELIQNVDIVLHLMQNELTR